MTDHIEWPLTLKNVTASPIMLEKQGWLMAVGSHPDLLNGDFRLEELANDREIKQHILDGNIVVNDGVSDLTPTQGADYLRRASKFYVDGKVTTLENSTSTSINDLTALLTAETTARTDKDALLDTSIDGINTQLTAATDARVLLGEEIQANEDALAQEVLDREAADDLKFDKVGGIVTGDIDASGYQVFVNDTPTASNSAVSKLFFEMKLKGQAPKAAVDVATELPLPDCLYNNGDFGIGATLTATENGVFPDIDGVTLALDQVFLYNQVGGAVENGVWVLTTLGDAATPWQVTRRPDLDGSPENELMPGTTIPVREGETWANYEFYLLGISEVSKNVGVDTIEFDKTPGSTATKLVQAEIDLIEQALNLNEDGSFKAHDSEDPYLTTALTSYQAREILSAALKLVSDKSDNNESKIANLESQTGEIGTTANQMAVIDGVVYGYDETRTAWLGPIDNFTFSRKMKKGKKYLKTGDGIVGYKNGAHIYRPMCITTLAVQLDSIPSSPATITIKKNDDPAILGSIIIDGVSGDHRKDLKIDLEEGDFLQIYAEGTDVSNPNVKIVAAYTEIHPDPEVLTLGIIDNDGDMVTDGDGNDVLAE